MANEASIRVGLSVRKRSGSLRLLEESWNRSYRADVDGTKGPLPGAFAVTTDGVAIDFSELTTPGWCWFWNQSSTYRIDIGPRDPDSALFYPMISLPPGKGYPVYLSPDLFEEYQGTGTGTGTAANTLWAKAFGGAATIYVGAFEA